MSRRFWRGCERAQRLSLRGTSDPLPFFIPSNRCGAPSPSASRCSPKTRRLRSMRTSPKTLKQRWLAIVSRLTRPHGTDPSRLSPTSKMTPNRDPENLKAADVLRRYKEEELQAFVEIPLEDVNQVGNFGDRPLHVASIRGNMDEIMALVAGGARSEERR